MFLQGKRKVHRANLKQGSSLASVLLVMFLSSCHGDPKYYVECDALEHFIVLVDDELMVKCCFYFRMMAYVVCLTIEFRNCLQTP